MDLENVKQSIKDVLYEDEYKDDINNISSNGTLSENIVLGILRKRSNHLLNELKEFCPKTYSHTLFIDAINIGGAYVWIISNLGRFEGIDENDEITLVDNLLNTYAHDELIQFMDNIKHINRNIIAQKLIDKASSSLILDNINKFPELDRKIIFEKLFETNSVEYIMEYLNCFKDIGEEYIINRLIESRKDLIVHIIRYFKNISQEYKQSTFDKIFELDGDLCYRRFVDLVGNKLDLTKMYKYILENEVSDIGMIFNYITEFSNIDIQDFIHQLTEKGLIQEYIGIIIELNGVDKNKMAYALIDSGNIRQLMEVYEKFGNINEGELIQKIVKANTGINFALRYIKKFKPENSQNLIDQLISNGVDSEIIANNIYEIINSGVDTHTIYEYLIKSESVYIIISYMSDFPNINKESLAQSLVAKGYAKELLQNIDNFDGISEDIIEQARKQS